MVKKIKDRRPLTDQGRENQIIAAAYELAEQRIRDGTATSQELTFFLKLGSSREKLEQERIARDTELLKAKKTNLDATDRYEEIATNAMAAMKQYHGLFNGDVIDEDEELF